MVVEHALVDPVVLLHENRKISHLVDRLDESRTPDVALGVWRALDQLSEFVAIALGPAHVPPALEDQELRLLLGVQVEAIAVENAAVDNEIIAFTERKRAVGALEHALALADVHQLVGLRVPVEVRVVFIGLDVEHGDVLVEQERDSVERGAAALLRARGQEMPVVERLVRVRLELHLAHAPHRFHRRRRMDVVEKC